MKNGFSVFIKDWDPMGFISDGASDDEYSVESMDVKLKFKPSMSDTEVAELIYKVFVERFGIDPDGFRDSCYERASEARKLLLTDAAKYKKM